MIAKNIGSQFNYFGFFTLLILGVFAVVPMRAEAEALNNSQTKQLDTALSEIAETFTNASFESNARGEMLDASRVVTNEELLAQIRVLIELIVTLQKQLVIMQNGGIEQTATGPRMELISPTDGQSFVIGDSIPIQYAYAGSPKNAQVVVSIEGVDLSGSGVAGGVWQSTELSPGSGNGLYTKMTGPSHLDVPGVYEISAVLRECDQRGCNYLTNVNGKILAKAIDRIRIRIEAAEDDVDSPEVNYMSCSRSVSTKKSLGALACYGLWDFGDAFGGDVDMCDYSPYSTPKTGCVVKTSVCKSGVAAAERVVDTYAPWFQKGTVASLATTRQIATIANNLKTETSVIKDELIRVWEYTCSDEASGETDTSIWSIPESSADIVVVGVYEGSYPSGEEHSYGYHPEGEVTVDVSSVNSENTLLILNAYEPVHWNITGDGTEYVKGVLVTGYYDQRVSGLDTNIPIVEQTYEGGAEGGEFFVVYNGEGEGDDEFPELVDYVEAKTGLTPYVFFGGYAESTVFVSLKG